MRRSDREVTDINEILSVINKCRVIRVAMRDDDELYIVPMNFGYDFSDGGLTFYLHSAHEGRKLDVIRKNPEVAFELDCDNGISGGELPCSYTCFYESVIGNGKAEILADISEKIFGLKLMMKATAKKDFDFDNEMAETVEVIKITAEKFSCKKH